ncbi:unnamed protein product [Peronospora belbahrii]|uniref:JmjC domain-containing protein n=1 Tax=Peronospora belbahrii TaxID=622444 RepID=A0ABN8CMG6_9STRA|nr:unnamed protein product [Peronospora belbahrii]
MDIKDATTLSYDEFCTHYMAFSRPVLLRNVTDKWFPNTTPWRDGQKINYQYLKKHYGTAVVPVASGNITEYGAEDRWTMRFDEYLDSIENEIAGKTYLKDWHFVHAFGHEIYETPLFFKNDWLNWWWDQKEKSESDYRFVYLGPAGSWTPLHQDVFRSYSWSVNICGRKQWVLFHPDDEPKLKDRFGRFVVPDVTATVIDKEKYPHFHEANPVYVVQETGDAIFVPSGWYHQVMNMEDTISINHNWFNGYNICEVWRFLKREYAAVAHELEELKEMGLSEREFVDQCQQVMLANTGINYIEFRELLYAKANEILSQREDFKANKGNGLTTVGSDLLIHLEQLNASLSTVDDTKDANVHEAWFDVDLQLNAISDTCGELVYQP